MKHLPTAEVATVTPQLARAWLGSNTGNRPARASGVKRYAEMMQRGAWHLSPDAIAFDRDGRLLNGQHRLQAVIMADTPQSFIVVRDLDNEGFMFYDGGFRRGLSDHLATLGHKNTNLLASIARVTANIARAGVASRALVAVSNSHDRLENDEILAFVDAYRDELEAATRFASNTANRSTVMPATVAGVVTALYGVEHEIEGFITQVCEGIGIADRRQPAHLLRKRLEPEFTNTARVVRPQRFEIFAYTFLAANLYVAGQSRAMLKWVPTKQMPFPQPDVDLAFWRERMPEWADEEEQAA